jgi:hypothetical protein
LRGAENFQFERGKRSRVASRSFEVDSSHGPKLFAMHLRSFLSLLALAAAGLLFDGCQTPATFPTPGPDWQTLTGQMQHIAPNGKSVIGEVVIRRSKQGDFQLAFASGPGFPLMRIWVSGSKARAEGAMAHGSWQGDPAKAPQHLRGWFQLPKVFAVKGHNRDLRVTEGGEGFVFHFAS